MKQFDFDKISIIVPQHKMIYKDYKSFGYNVYPTYISENLFLRILREIVFKFNLPFKNLFYSKIKGNWDFVILYDALVSSDYLKYISKTISPNKLVLFLDNIVGDRISLILTAKELGIPVVTLEKEDQIKYKIYRIDDFFNKEYVLHSNVIEYDVVFFGKDKGRLKQLVDIENILKSKGLLTHFHITKTYRTSKNNRIFKKTIPYKTLLEYVSKSKAILEIMQEGQNGITLRAMESIYFGKKLITNSPSIKNQSFYNKKNIFILGEDNDNDLVTFVNSPVESISQSILDYREYRNAWTRVLNEIVKDGKKV